MTIMNRMNQKNEKSLPRILLTLPEAAAWLGVSPGEVRRRLARLEILAVSVAGRRYIPPSELAAQRR